MTSTVSLTGPAPDVQKHERGVFVVIEGLDRSGKSTHARSITQALKDADIPAEFMCFPNRTSETGKKIDAFLQNKADYSDKQIHDLYTSNRVEFQQAMETLLSKGVSLIVDRYSFSGAAFTAAKDVKGLELDAAFATELGLVAPDVVVFFDVSPEVAMKRGGFGNERYETTVFQAKVRVKFGELMERSPSWFAYKEALARGSTGTSSAVAVDETTTDGTPVAVVKPSYVAPWHKLSSDGEFEQVETAVKAIFNDVLAVQKSQPLHRFGPLPVLDNTFKFE